MMNAFEIDVHEEETAVELFAKNIMTAGQSFFGISNGVSKYSYLE